MLLFCLACHAFIFFILTFRRWFKMNQKATMADTSNPTNFAQLTCVRTLMQLRTLLSHMQCQTMNILLVLATPDLSRIFSLVCLRVQSAFNFHSSVWALPPLYLGVIKLQRVDKNYSWRQMLFQVRKIKTSASQVQSSYI